MLQSAEVETVWRFSGFEVKLDLKKDRKRSIETID